MKSQHAQAAQQIKAILKAKFPTVKFNVKSSIYSGGSSVRIEYTDGPVFSEVENLVKGFQYGTFDGMTDCYNVDNNIEGLPQVKYVQITREKSEKVIAEISEEIKATYGGCENFNPDMYYNNFQAYGYTLIHRIFWARDYVGASPAPQATEPKEPNPIKSIAQVNKENPEKYVMVSYEFGYPIYIGPLENLNITVTDKESEATKWSYADSLSEMKLKYHIAVTGYKGLKFEKASN